MSSMPIRSTLTHSYSLYILLRPLHPSKEVFGALMSNIACICINKVDLEVLETGWSSGKNKGERTREEGIPELRGYSNIKRIWSWPFPRGELVAAYSTDNLLNTWQVFCFEWVDVAQIQIIHGLCSCEVFHSWGFVQEMGLKKYRHSVNDLSMLSLILFWWHILSFLSKWSWWGLSFPRPTLLSLWGDSHELVL